MRQIAIPACLMLYILSEVTYSEPDTIFIYQNGVFRRYFVVEVQSDGTTLEKEYSTGDVISRQSTISSDSSSRSIEYFQAGRLQAIFRSVLVDTTRYETRIYYDTSGEITDSIFRAVQIHTVIDGNHTTVRECYDTVCRTTEFYSDTIGNIYRVAMFDSELLDPETDTLYMEFALNGGLKLHGYWRHGNDLMDQKWFYDSSGRMGRYEYYYGPFPLTKPDYIEEYYYGRGQLPNSIRTKRNRITNYRLRSNQLECDLLGRLHKQYHCNSLIVVEKPVLLRARRGDGAGR